MVLNSPFTKTLYIDLPFSELSEMLSPRLPQKIIEKLDFVKIKAVFCSEKDSIRWLRRQTTDKEEIFAKDSSDKNSVMGGEMNRDDWDLNSTMYKIHRDFPCSLVGKQSACNAGD